MRETIDLGPSAKTQAVRAGIVQVDMMLTGALCSANAVETIRSEPRSMLNREHAVVQRVVMNYQEKVQT